MSVLYPFYADLYNLIGQGVEILADRQYEGKVVALHKTFVQVGIEYDELSKEWVKTDLVWLDEIVNVRPV